jgi:hypothetical protein
MVELVIAGTGRGSVLGVGFCRPHLGGGNFKFLLCLLVRGFLLGNLQELLHIFENLLERLSTGHNILIGFLLFNNLYKNKKPLHIGLGMRFIAHQVT